MQLSVEKKHTVKAIAFLSCLAGILVVRSFFSFCQTDESFYVAMFQRIWNGGRMFWDEWNSAQIYVPLMLPFYGLYTWMAGTTDGVILFFRIVTVVFSFYTSIKLFFLVRKAGGDILGAVAAAGTVLLFCRGNIQGPSYYNLCALCGISGFCSACSAELKRGRDSEWKQFCAGVLIACSVLCDPFFAPVVILLVSVGVIALKKTRQSAMFCLGIFMMALLYCSFLLLTTGQKRIFETLPYTLYNRVICTHGG